MRLFIVLPIVALVGSLVILFVMISLKEQKRRLKPDTEPTELIAHSWEMELLKRLPTRLLSFVWGKLANITVPVSLRPVVYGIYARMYNCNLEEMMEPLESYPSLAKFFGRRLKEGARIIDPAALISPVDGTVLHFGEIHEDELEQIKGISYSLTALVGEKSPIVQARERGDYNKFYHIVLYLGPGDYHGIHSPSDWNVKQRRHFPGYLFPVAPYIVNYIRGLFSLNERIVLTGEWKYGFFSLITVGATNVGSMVLTFDPELQTNRQPRPRQKYFERDYEELPQGVLAKKGDELGFFYMGSTVVLLFESEPNFAFTVSAGEKIKLGQQLGIPIPNTHSSTNRSNKH